MRFIALPVAQGDAFYAETDDGFRVLVDGGGSRTGFADLFRKHANLYGVDVLVCTHNDADHTEGVIGFLESYLDCKELWLPSTWLHALNNLPPDAGETLRFVWERFVEIDRDRLWKEERDPQQAAWQALFPELPEKQRETRSEEPAVWQEGVRDATVNDLLGEVMDAINDHIEMVSAPGIWPWRVPCYWYGDRRDFLMTVVAKDVRRLLELALLALHRGIPIRCFSHDPHSARPVRGYPLSPVSSKQEQEWYVPAMRKGVPEEFLFLAYLTTVNKESLVFYLEAPREQPGILFTADSDLKDVDLGPVQDGSIVTAPHHGSKDNARVYSLFRRSMVWVRSDKRSRHRPCKEYLSAPGWRFCTLCRDSNRPKQAVRLYMQKGRWVSCCSTVPCSCR